MKKRYSSLGLLAACCWLPMGMALAQQAPPQAGESLRLLEERELTLPEPTPPVLEITTSSPAEAPEADVLIPVQQFRIEGNQALSSDALLARLSDLTGRELTLAELFAAADRLTAYYRAQGYLVSQAYLPAQEIGADGVITLAIAEGQYGNVTLDNHSRLNERLPSAMLSELARGDAVTLAPLERQLLLLNDLPGTRAHSSLAAGSAAGESDLTVTLEDAPRVSGAVKLDNHGNRHTGKYRLSTRLNVASPLGLGDEISLHLLGSDEEQLYYQAHYDLPVNRWGTRAGVSASRMDYDLGGAFDELEASGTAETLGAFVSHPWQRSRTFNLYSQLHVERKELEDELFDGLIVNDKTANNVTLGLSGDWRDSVGGGAVNAFSLNRVQGRLSGDTQHPGSFGKWQFSLLRLQHLTGKFTLYTAVQGQVSDGNLDASERFSLGGPYAVRGYPVGETSANEGVTGSVELRYQWQPEWQFKAFADAGYARLERQEASNADRQRDLNSVGLGAQWQPHPRLQFSAHSAWRTGERAQSDKERSPRLWAQAQWAF